VALAILFTGIALRISVDFWQRGAGRVELRPAAGSSGSGGGGSGGGGSGGGGGGIGVAKWHTVWMPDDCEAEATQDAIVFRCPSVVKAPQ
jgi:hypothetical protein